MITKKTKIVGGLSLILLVGAIAGVLLAWQYVHTKGEELVHETTVVANFNARDQRYTELAQLIDATRADRDILTSYLLSEKDTIEFLSSIERVAVEQGVDLVTNSLQVVPGTGLFDTLVISFALEGQKSHVYTMLRVLETLPYHGYVTKLSFHESEKNGATITTGTVELTVSLIQYDR